MSLKTSLIRLFCSVFAGVLLLLQPARAQQNYPEIERAFKMNQQALGRDAVMMIYYKGKIVYESSLGDFTVNSPQKIASCSKWLSAALVMTFVDEGKLSLDDTVGKFLPIFTQYKKGNIRIKDLLSHTLGLEQEPIRLLTLINRNNKYNNLEEETNDFAKKKDRVAEPGAEFRYGNMGLNIAGRILEVIAGKNFEEIFQEKLGRTLGMGSTTFIKNGDVPNPSGGAVSTAADYMNFQIMFLNKGVFRGKRILQKSTIEKMIEVAAPSSIMKYSPDAAAGFDYGYGLWIQEKDSKGSSVVVSSPGLFGTWPYVDYCRHYACIIFTKNLLGEKKKDLYLAIKKAVDVYFPESCNQ